MAYPTVTISGRIEVPGSSPKAAGSRSTAAASRSCASGLASRTH